MTHAELHPERPPYMAEDEARLRTKLYLKQRIDYQDNYYQRRIEEFNYNSEVMLWASAFLMGISTVISSYSVVAESPWAAFFTALLPAFAAAVSAFRALYQWQRQATIYESSWLALQQTRLAMPDENFMYEGDYSRYFPPLVRQAELVLRNEANQWGQLEEILAAQAKEGEAPEPDAPVPLPMD